MKYDGATHLHRLTAFLLTLMMLMTTWIMPASAVEDWNGLSITVNYTDVSGMPMSIPATPVLGSDPPAYWVTLDPMLLDTFLEVQVQHPDPEYRFYFNDQTLSLLWTPMMDATGLDPYFANYIGYDYQGVYQNQFILLYVSSQGMPMETEPNAPVDSSVQIPVRYVLEDGTQLDMHYVTGHRDQMVDVWAASEAARDYTLIGSNVQQVYVDAFGVTSPGEVVFVYKQDVFVEEITPAPIMQAQVNVLYQMEDGTLLDQQTKLLNPGDHEIWPESSAVGGLELAGAYSANVYVDDFGNASPDVVTFTYRQPYVAPAEATIQVYYYHENGELLDTQELRRGEGTHMVWPESNAVAGLELISDQSVTVTVYADGTTDLASISFLYKDPYVAPAEALIPVYYYHENGELLDTREVRLGEGTHTIWPDSNAVAGLEIVGDQSATVTVYADGTADQPNIVFLYKDPYVAPLNAEVTVIYQLEDGTLLDQQVVSVQQGENTLWPDSKQTAGLSMRGDGFAYVYVDNGGQASPNPVVFTYYRNLIPVTVYYFDTMGEKIATSQTFEYAPGVYDISAAPTDLPSGYELMMDPAMTVTVFEDGSTDPEEIGFYYRKAEVITPEPVQPVEPAKVPVTVHYFDTMGEKIATSQTFEYAPGVYDISAAPTDLPSGYELMMDPAMTVTVFEDGSTDPEEIGFYYRKAEVITPEPVQPVEPAKVPVTVHYFDTMGEKIATSQTFEYAPGVYDISANPTDLPSGYELMMEPTMTMTVFEDGSTDPEEIGFYYRKAEVITPEPVQPVEPAKVPVTVHYFDTMGEKIATSQTFEYTPGVYDISAAPTDLPSGYELMMEPTMTVTVFEDGSTDPEEIGFYYRPAPKNADVHVTYTDRSGRIIAGPFTVQLAPSQYHTVTADPDRVPEGYDPGSAASVEVYVSREGVATPDRVVLAFDEEVRETPIPVGESVNRYASLNKNSVAFRTQPNTGRDASVIRRLNRGDKVYIVRELYNAENERWAEIIVDGRSGYMMSEFLDTMTQAESDRYAATTGASPVPTYTPVPTEVPTQVPVVTEPPIVEVIIPVTATPTASPTASPTPFVPTATPTAAPYIGYALTTRSTALRTGINASDVSIIHHMEANQLVRVSGQVYDPVTRQPWSIVTNLNNMSGYVLDADLRYISDTDAGYYIEAWEIQNATPVPTQVPTNTPEPVQVQGYAVAIGYNVPLRTLASEYSSISAQLQQGEVVFVTGQTVTDGITWHSVQYEGTSGGWGYIRSDLLRMMTREEQDAYLSQYFATPTPTYVTTNRPFDENGMSSYGYVDSSSVNFREGPSTDARRIRSLSRYALCLVLGTEYSGGETWYKVKYGNQEGYLHGDYFHQLRISELNTFLSSAEYRQGIANNSANGSNAGDDVGFTGPGGLVSEEDQTINQWQDPNSGVHVSYAPFNPIGTVAPINPTDIPTLEPLPGWQATATWVPTATPTNTLPQFPTVTYPSDNGSGGSGSALVWIVVVVLFLIVGAGVFAFARYRQNRRKIAMRAAQRRAQAARSAEQQRPYARQAGQNGQPRTGMYPNPGQQQPVRNAYQPTATAQQPTASQQPRRPASPSSYARPQASYTPYSDTPAQTSSSVQEKPTPQEDVVNPAGRVGRRTAYRQAQEAQKKTDISE